ncbi:hypothetical protein tinsulaeT_05560 [Thalassotalea insulae]|uniref:DUF1330 domain-containing protein n=1 Tax=Thalassotalea insulae TaxID=2056778 RepID=A0ABQ6GMW5_9GAMM|nr:DUF1330 domain-containing protein [Thalassotalea insulae]GLX77216.1 hypothetical protein tinsulaeT_05560 [Thalassotalea insulae]
MSAYCLFQNINITDPGKMAEYVEKVQPITQSFGGEYVVMGGNSQIKEGSWSPVMPVIIKFPTMEAANAWYDSEEYAPLKALRMSAGEFSAVFIGAQENP